MKRSRLKTSLGVLIIAALTLSATAAVSAAPPDVARKGPPEMGKVVSVHYPRGLEAKGGIPGAPDNQGKQDKEWFKYGGIHWPGESPLVQYVVNLSGSGGDGTFLGGITAAFQEWEDDAESSIDFDYLGPFVGTPSSYVGEGDTNGFNEVGWVDLTDIYPRAIAVTTTWYNVATREIGEVDFAFNSDLPWAQAVLDDATTSGHYDVQNIATHEAGHWLMLLDMYNPPARSQTMYGYSAPEELTKRSLESGDLAGLRTIYPLAS